MNLRTRIIDRINRARSIDLDAAGQLPSFVAVVASDEHGPLVVAVDDATVRPDGSVRTHGRWLVSTRFGMKLPRTGVTATIPISGEVGIVLARRGTVSEFLANSGPRLATLGRFRPRIATVFSATRLPLHDMFDRCNVTVGHVFVDRGSEYRVDKALFARLPVDHEDPQHAAFLESVLPTRPIPSGDVYLEHTDLQGFPLSDEDSVAKRLDASANGFRLVAPARRRVSDVIDIVASAASIVVESPRLGEFTSFASGTTPISVAKIQPVITRSALSRRVTSEFDMDAAMLNGTSFPQGVDVISRPDYEVETTTSDAHALFDGGRWQSQDPRVLRQRSPGPWLFAVRNALVSAGGSVLLNDGTRLRGHYFGDPRREFSLDGWIGEELPGRAGLALTMSRPFGHWLLQVAPRVDALRRFDPSMTMLLPDSDWDDSALVEHSGLDERQVFRVPRFELDTFVRVPELIVSTQLHPERNTARADPRWAAEFAERFAGPVDHYSQRRVYMARRDDSGARGGCVNRHDLRRIADDFGYETVVPETLSLTEQLRLARSTVDMMGEQGSNLTLSMFMPSGSVLTTIRNKFVSRQDGYMTYHNPVLAAQRSRYHEVVAIRAGGPSHFEIDPRIVRQALENRP